jgi:hypothetical protein
MMQRGERIFRRRATSRLAASLPLASTLGWMDGWIKYTETNHFAHLDGSKIS